VSIRGHLALLVVLTLASLGRADITFGTSREKVVEQLGKPTSAARRGEHEILLYPKGLRIEFRDGKVVTISGALPSTAPSSNSSPPKTPAQPAALKTEPTPPANAPVPAGAAPVTAAPVSAPTATTAPALPLPPSSASGRHATDELAKRVEKMNTPWGEAPPVEEVHSPMAEIQPFLTGLALRFCFMVTALKLAFRFWEMDAFWRGIFAIAGIDVALHAVFELLGPVTGGFTSMGAVANGIPGLALIYTINRFCFNKRLQNAVMTAAAVKLAVTLCYIFAGVATLNAIYG
jgi:hypothetical protein